MEPGILNYQNFELKSRTHTEYSYQNHNIGIEIERYGTEIFMKMYNVKYKASVNNFQPDV